MPPAAVKPGPDSARVASVLRSEIAAGRFPIGQFMPCTRDLAKKHNVSFGTTRRAMKILETEGLLASEPRHGFQVVRIPDKKKATVLAYVLSQGGQGKWHSFSALMLGTFQNVAARHGFSLLGIGADASSPEAIVEHIRKAGAGGVILDDMSTGLAEAVGKMGLATVNAEVWSTTSRFDSVLQDNFGGALQAAEYLAERGHKRIAWFGPSTGSIHADERWGGAVVGLHRHGIQFAPELVLEGNRWRDPEQVQSLLRHPARPTGVICLWANVAIGVARAAARLGLRIGHDLDLVGWATEEEYADYEASFPEGQAPATVTWRIERLAEAVMARLAERRAKPNLPVVRTIVETQLRSATATMPAGGKPNSAEKT